MCPKIKIQPESSRAWLGALLVVLCSGLFACSGSVPESDVGMTLPQVQATSDSTVVQEPLPISGAWLASPAISAGVSMLSVTPLPAPDPGLLLLLLPDAQDRNDPRVRAWIDAALEEGVRMQPISDTEFLQLGDTALDYAGLVLPDDLHVLASDALIDAVQRYTETGGKTLLVFDFGALTLAGDVPVYAVPRSRLSGMAGVDYVLYDQLRERTTGLGPVVGARSTLRSLLVPPGKSMLFSGLSSTSSFVNASTTPATNASSTGGPLLAAAGVSEDSALYLPVSTRDPGGARGFDVQQYSQQGYFSGRSSSRTVQPKRQVQIHLGQARRGEPVMTTSLITSPVTRSTSGSVSTFAVTDPQEAWSGYLLGPLIYPSYVTQGEFGSRPGQRMLAHSPQFGLVAGINPVGAGQVLFVNLPLTYLKSRTDALMMHGFLHLFTREVLQLPHLSAMPNGVAGITLDWHLDAKQAQAPTQKLIKLNVFNDPKALFSIEMTAGPDVAQPGDMLGWNLPKNKTAQQFLRSFSSAGHAVGSHGGWIHDYYGSRVNETNRLQTTEGGCFNSLLRLDNYEQCLVLNRQAVDGVLGKATASYSAPEGNNPLWAMDWLEQQGVVAAYFGGHTGLGATRQYRDGQLRNPSVWVFPVTPQGLYATFEEFQDYKVPQSDVKAWYQALADFSVAQNTSRMVYAHPAGAAAWSSVLLDFLAYVKSQSAQLSWYTTLRLARFMSRRLDVSWTQALDPATGKVVFTASHPSSLAEMTWRLPRTRYPQAPQVTEGHALVDGSDTRYWQVRATGGTQLSFVL